MASEKATDTKDPKGGDATTAADAPAARLDETVPGGRYLVKGRLVDAHGKPLDVPAEKS